jgi:hypothetical protein
MRPRLCYWLLVLIPFLVYCPGIVREYGLHDDYAHIREAKEEPGKIARFVTAQGRPFYGAMLESSFARIDSVANLKFLRLASVGFLALLGIILWRHLDTNGWPQWDALALSLAIILLPAAQISVGWALGWPWICSIILSVAGFLAVETELAKGGLKRGMGILGGLVIYMLSALIYQPNAMFAVVMIAATVLPRIRMRTRRELKVWFGWHLAILLLSLLLSFLFLKLIFSGGGVHESSRIVFEHSPFSKLFWIFSQMLPNALGLYVLRCDFHTLPGAIFFWLTAVGVLAFISWIAPNEQDNDGGSERLKWWLCLTVLPWVAMFISIIAAERNTGYRVLFPLSGLVLVIVFACLRRLPVDKEVEPRLRYVAMGLIVLVGAILAAWNTSELLAKPQNREWNIVRDAVLKARYTEKTRFYVIEPAVEDRSTDLMHSDEFGSLSSGSPGIPQEMFKAGLRLRFPKGVPKGYKIEFAEGKEVPAEGACDVLIDLRELKRWRE